MDEYGRPRKYESIIAVVIVSIMLLVAFGILYGASLNHKYGTPQECTPYAESLGVCWQE